MIKSRKLWVRHISLHYQDCLEMLSVINYSKTLPSDKSRYFFMFFFIFEVIVSVDI